MFTIRSSSLNPGVETVDLDIVQRAGPGMERQLDFGEHSAKLMESPDLLDPLGQGSRALH
jgi:hypothetical protein